MTKLKNMREFAQSIFPGLSVRVGVPHKLKGLFDELKGPENSTVIGLLMHRSGKNTQYEIDNKKRLLHNKEELDTLSNIKLGSSNTATAETSSVSSSQASSEKESSTFIFDDLSKVEGETGDFVSKVKNWIKQLF
jgi:cell division protein FtsA